VNAVPPSAAAVTCLPQIGPSKMGLESVQWAGQYSHGPTPSGQRVSSFLKPTQRVKKSAPTKPKAAGATGEREPTTTVRRRGPKRSSPPTPYPDRVLRWRRLQPRLPRRPGASLAPSRAAPPSAAPARSPSRRLRRDSGRAGAAPSPSVLR
jgi:hypothetical protein